MRTIKLVFCLSMVMFLLAVPVANAAPSLQTPDEEMIVRWDEDWPTYMDPAVGSDFSDCMAIINLYDSLVFPNEDGTVRPHLATDWEVSEDGLTYTFNLRDDVKFHNGDTLTASDVAFSANRLLEIGEGFAYLFAAIEEVTAIDDYTVQFKLKEAFGPFLLALVRLYILNEDEVMANAQAEGIYEDKGDYGREWLLTHDAGSGPYQVKEMKMEEHLIGEWFPEWWGGWEEGAPKYFKEMASTSPVTMLTLMSNREIEISDEFQPLESLKALDEISGVDIVTFYNAHNLNLMLNTQVPPTDDIHFRKALAYIMDYETVITAIWPDCIQSVGPVPFNLPGHNPNLYQYKRDPEKAAEELALSPYADKLDEYPLTLSWCAEVPDEEKLALLFQSNCAELGIDVEIYKNPFGKMIDDAQTMETTPNVSIIFVAPHYSEAGSMLESRYHSKSQGTWEQCEWLGIPDIDEAIDDALATIDQEERFAKYAAIQEELVELCPTVWIFDQAERRAFQDYIYFPAAEAAKAGEPVSPVMGYVTYVHDMKVFPEQRQERLAE